jgi:hypothetical protein
LALSTAVSIEERDEPGRGRPGSITVRARGDAVDLVLDLEVEEALATRLGPGAAGGAGRSDFLQLRALYRVEGTAGERSIRFTAPGVAETFRGVER